MNPISVFGAVRKRRMAIGGTAVALVVIALVVLSANFFGNSKKARAVDFEASANRLVVPAGTLLYIGAPGYVSQRLYSLNAEPINAAHQLTQTIGTPAGHGYNIQVTNINCPDASVWGQGFSSCRAIVGDGTGMILKYSSNIDIYGTVVVGDRVAFDTSNINIFDTGKIFANGQDNQLALGNDCGAGGIGGINGGTAATSLTALANGHLACSRAASGQPSTVASLSSYNLPAINSDVNVYFTSTNGQVTGGSGSASGDVTYQIGTPGVAGPAAAATTGVGGGGGSGPTSDTGGGNDRGGSGGGGGGFGLAFKSSNMTVNTSAIITAAGGNSRISGIGTMGETSGSSENDTGAFGGPGAGGTVIIDSPGIFFATGDTNQNQTNENFSIFNTKAGILKSPTSWDLNPSPADAGTLKSPPGAGDGKLIINAGSGSVSIKKSVQNLGNGDGQLRPNYVFRPGDNVAITLDVVNLTPGSRYTIDDEVFSDGVNLGSTVNTISDGGVLGGLKVTWSLVATSTKKTLTYKLIIQ